MSIQKENVLPLHHPLSLIPNRKLYIAPCEKRDIFAQAGATTRTEIVKPRPFIYPATAVIVPVEPQLSVSKDSVTGSQLGSFLRDKLPLTCSLPKRMSSLAPNMRTTLDLRTRPFTDYPPCPYANSAYGPSIIIMLAFHGCVDRWRDISSERNSHYAFWRYTAQKIIDMCTNGAKVPPFPLTYEINSMNHKNLRIRMGIIKLAFIETCGIKIDDLSSFDIAVLDTSLRENKIQPRDRENYQILMSHIKNWCQPHKLEGSNQYGEEAQVYNVILSDVMSLEMRPYDPCNTWKLFTRNDGTFELPYTSKPQMMKAMKKATSDFELWKIIMANMVCDLRFICLTEHLLMGGKKAILVTADKLQAYICALLKIPFHYVQQNALPS